MDKHTKSDYSRQPSPQALGRKSPLPNEVLRTSDEVCLILNISRQTLWRMIKLNPSIPGRYQVGRSVRWSERELMQWLSKRNIKH